MVLSLELKAKKNIWWKIQKTAFECPFEIIGFTYWPNVDQNDKSVLSGKFWVRFDFTSNLYLNISIYVLRWKEV